MEPGDGTGAASGCLAATPETEAARRAREDAYYADETPMCSDFGDDGLGEEGETRRQVFTSAEHGTINHRPASGAVGDDQRTPLQVMESMFRKIEADVGLNIVGRKFHVSNAAENKGEDECQKAMDEVVKKRFECVRRIKDTYADDFDAQQPDGEMKKEIDAVEGEADRCQKMLWYWEVMKRAARSVKKVIEKDTGKVTDDDPQKFDQHRRDLPPSMNIKTIKELQDDKTMSTYNQCILHIQECVRHADLRRHGGEVFTKATNSLREPTIAWKKLGSLRKFIFENITEASRPDLWTAVTNTQTVDKIEKYFEEADPCNFPALIKNRNLFSYDDGVFDAKSGEFHRYPLDPGNRVGLYSAARHFEKPFPSAFYRGAEDISHWRDIPTPGVRSVFEYQGLSVRDDAEDGLKADSVEDWFYRLVGRMFFEIGELDDFQVFIYILGRAGTGKSTLAHNAAAGVYEDDDVKQGDNMIERQFGLWPLMDALIVKFTEVKSNFQLDQAQLQEMVSGGCVSVARKNLIAAQKARWQAHLVMCGNEMPGYRDAQGSLQRRYVIFNMTKKVVNENADLKRVMVADMPYFILKCAMAYRELVVYRGVRAGIWNHLPKHFADNRDSVADNSLEMFLRSDRVMVQKNTGDTGRCDFKDFKQEYKRFCADECITRNVDLTVPSQYSGVFSDHGIMICNGHGRYIQGAVLDGVGIAGPYDSTALFRDPEGDVPASTSAAPARAPAAFASTSAAPARTSAAPARNSAASASASAFASASARTASASAPGSSKSKRKIAATESEPEDCD